MMGILSTLLLVYTLYKHHQEIVQQSDKQCVTVYVDNTEAITKAKTEKIILNISETLRAEYDIERLINDIKTLLPFQVRFQWGKGHQMKIKKEKDKVSRPRVRPEIFIAKLLLLTAYLCCLLNSYPGGYNVRL